MLAKSILVVSTFFGLVLAATASACPCVDYHGTVISAVISGEGGWTIPPGTSFDLRFVYNRSGALIKVMTDVGSVPAPTGGDESTSTTQADSASYSYFDPGYLYDPNFSGLYQDYWDVTASVSSFDGTLPGTIYKKDYTYNLAPEDGGYAAVFFEQFFWSNGDPFYGPYDYTANVQADITSVTIYGAPEPSTWAMMLLGFAGLSFARYRRESVAHARGPE